MVSWSIQTLIQILIVCDHFQTKGKIVFKCLHFFFDKWKNKKKIEEKKKEKEKNWSFRFEEKSYFVYHLWLIQLTTSGKAAWTVSRFSWRAQSSILGEYKSLIKYWKRTFWQSMLQLSCIQVDWLAFLKGFWYWNASKYLIESERAVRSLWNFYFAELWIFLRTKKDLFCSQSCDKIF